MADVDGFLNIDYAHLEQAWAAEDIHEQKAMEMFGKVTPETRRLAKIVNFGELYGGNMNKWFSYYHHKFEDILPPKESDLVIRARAFLEVGERFGPIQQEWLTARYDFRRECGRADFPLDHRKEHLERAAERIVANADRLLHPYNEQELC